MGSSNPLAYAHNLYLNGEKINDLIIPDDVTMVKDRAFYGCSCLSSVYIHDGVKEIGMSAFEDCSSLTSVTLLDGLTSIGESAFRSCCSLASVTLPNSVTTIGRYVFYGCSGLTSVTFPHNIGIPGHAFQNCSSLTSVTIPNSVTSIGDYAFSGCRHLKYVSIGYNVGSIGSEAFAECINLEDVYCYAEEVPSTKSWGTYNEPFKDAFIEYATLHVAMASMEKYKNEEPWSKFGKIIALMPTTYTLTYMVNNEVYKTMEIESGKTVPHEENPIKEGYMFSGWSNIPTTMPEHDVIVTGYLIASLEVGKTYTFQNDGSYLSISSQYANYTNEPFKLRLEDAGDGEYYITNGVYYIGQTYGMIISFGLVSVPDKNDALKVYITGKVINDQPYYILHCSAGQLDIDEGWGLQFSKENDFDNLWVVTEVAPDLVDNIKSMIINDGEYQIYTIDGKPIKTLQKGVNIIHFSDGTTKKVYVK